MQFKTSLFYFIINLIDSSDITDFVCNCIVSRIIVYNIFNDSAIYGTLIMTSMQLNVIIILTVTTISRHSEMDSALLLYLSHL
jgi:hypothetical protein